MRKLLIIFVSVLVCFSFVACEKGLDGEKPSSKWTFDYPKEILCGKWTSMQVLSNGKWEDYSDDLFANMRFNFTFGKDGSFQSKDWIIVHGKGTYVADGKKIKIYDDGKPFDVELEVTSMTETDAEIVIWENGKSITGKYKKVN